MFIVWREEYIGRGSSQSPGVAAAGWALARGLWASGIVATLHKRV